MLGIENHSIEAMNYVNSGMPVGGLTTDSGSNIGGTFTVPYNPEGWYGTSYISCYPWYHTLPDKTAQALRVLKHLTEKKLIKLNTVPEFIKAMEELAGVL